MMVFSDFLSYEVVKQNPDCGMFLSMKLSREILIEAFTFLWCCQAKSWLRQFPFYEVFKWNPDRRISFPWCCQVKSWLWHVPFYDNVTRNPDCTISFCMMFSREILIAALFFSLIRMQFETRRNLISKSGFSLYWFKILGKNYWWNNILVV
jgi:hypothetical protein